MIGLSDKTVLVTGATGFVGQHLVRRLRAEGCGRLVLLSRRRLPATDPDVAVAAGLDELTEQTWRNAGVDAIHVVLHLGAFTPKSHEEANLAPEIYRANIEGTRRLLESLPASMERIVFASTLDVYAPSQGQPLSETSPIGPSTLYGASKFFSEQAVRLAARARGCICAVLRYGHLFGPGEDAYRKLIPHTMQLMLRGEEPTVFGDGSALRDLLYVDDAVVATLRAAQLDEADPGAVNIVRGASVTIRHIVETLVALTGYRGGICYLTDRPPGHSLQFDDRRMRELLGEWDRVSVEEGLRREVEYCLAGGSRQ